jgi:polyribonucleotide 5'-hydroxyl-kinase
MYVLPSAVLVHFVVKHHMQGAFTVPGAVSAAPVSHPIGTSSATFSLGSSASSRPLHSQSNALLPLCYWYGHPPIQRNPLLLERIVRNLGENINDRWDYDAEGRASGLIVDTPASFASNKAGAKGPDHRINMLKGCVDAFGSMLIHTSLYMRPLMTFQSTLYLSSDTKSLIWKCTVSSVNAVLWSRYRSQAG